MNNRLVVNADSGRETVSRHIYGHFAEHLGRCIYEGIWVGENSPIPNTRGIRNDVVAALKQLNIPNLRWPGGCFADEYHWKDGIGPRHERPLMANTSWGGVTETNHFGTHEFMDLCEILGCEPYICGNVGSGTVREMAEWVEYLTYDGRSAMADLRRKNGREKPWQVRFWGVGNENWGCGGCMRARYYADEYRRYQSYCRNLSGNVLYKVACGLNEAWNELRLREAGLAWNEVLMREAGRFMDGLSIHYYTGAGPNSSATQFGEEEWFRTLKNAGLMEDIIRRNTAIMDRYDPEGRVGMIIDEWGTWYTVEPGTNPSFLYQQNTLRDALAAGITLNIFNHHCNRVKMANIAQTINVLQAMILTEGARMLCTPTYHVFEMYKVHQDAVLLPLTLDCGLYERGQEALSILSASASRDKAGKMHISLCNLHPDNEAELVGDIRGASSINTVEGKILTSKAMNAHNTFTQPNEVRPAAFNEVKLLKTGFTAILPPKSVVVLELK